MYWIESKTELGIEVLKVCSFLDTNALDAISLFKPLTNFMIAKAVFNEESQVLTLDA